MKKINLLLGILILLAVSCAKIDKREAEVVKNCTGVYLRYDKKSYAVCNEEMLSDYNAGDRVTAKFKHIDTCNRDMSHNLKCFLLYESHGTIKVLKIK